MKILTFSSQIHAHGAYMRQRRMVDALVDAGNDVYWIAPAIKISRKEKFIPLSNSKIPNMIFGGILIKLIITYYKNRKKLSDPDLIFVTSEYWAMAVKLFPKFGNITTIFFQRGDSYEILKYCVKYPVDRFDFITKRISLLFFTHIQKIVLNRVDCVCVQAEFLKQNLINRIPDISCNIEVLPNDCAKYYDNETSSDHYESYFKTMGEQYKNVIGIVAPIYWHGKGVKFFFDMLKFLSVDEDNIFLIIGSGPDDNLVSQAIENLKEKHNVKFLGKIDNVSRYMHYFDLFFVPTQMFDACPNVVLEILDSETPIIASDINAHKELLQFKEMLFCKDNPNESAEKVKELLSDVKLMQKNKSYVVKRKKMYTFDWDRKIVEVVEGAMR